MQLPYYPKRESIGIPEIFYGRKKEIDYFLKWCEGIPGELSKSHALMATKKMGKTALLERLYNILFVKQGKVIPFYFRVPEEKEWKPNFGRRFYLVFMNQYLAFKLNQPKWIDKQLSLEKLLRLCQENGFDEIEEDLEIFEGLIKEKEQALVWNYASGAPHRLAAVTGDRFLQLIDEFQFLNHYIYADQDFRVRTELAGTYLGLAESKVAPLLVSGSYLGWLRKIVQKLISRFTYAKLDPFSPEESWEAIQRYAKIFEVELNKKGAKAVQKMSRNHPFYISSLIRSSCPSKDLTTQKGVMKVYQFEVKQKQGEILRHWREYIEYAFDQTNGKIAKAITLYLAQDSKTEKTRTEILEHLERKKITLETGEKLSDRELEKRLILLERSDIIAEGANPFRFKGIGDEVFDQVFQILYSEEIDNVKKEDIEEKIWQKNWELLEEKEKETYQKNKGSFLESLMIDYLKFKSEKPKSPALKELVQNLPKSAFFVPYQTVGPYHFNLPEGHHRNAEPSQFDTLAKAAQEGDPSLLVECKYWKKPVDTGVVKKFAQKAEEARQEISPLIPIFYSVSGFTAPALKTMKELGIAWSTREYWDILSGD